MENPSRICMPSEKNLTWRSIAFVEPCEFNDLVESFAGKLAAHAEHGAVEKDVFSSRQVGMDAAGHAEERTQAAHRLTRAGRLVRGPTDDLEQGCLPRTVDADEPQCSARLDLDTDVLQHPSVGLLAPLRKRATGAEELVVEERRRPVGAELLPHVVDVDGTLRQCRQNSPRTA